MSRARKQNYCDNHIISYTAGKVDLKSDPVKLRLKQYFNV